MITIFSKSARQELASRIRTHRRRASIALQGNGVRLRLIFTALLTLTFFVAGIYVCECAFYAVPWREVYLDSPAKYELLNSLLYAVDGAVVLFLGLPILHGALCICFASAEGKRLPFSTLFDAFQGASRYFRTLALMLCFVLRYAAPVLIVWAGFALPGRVTSLSPALVWILATIGVLLALALLFLLGRDDAILALSYRHPEYSLRRLFHTSHRMMRGQLRQLALFKLSFVGWAALSVLSFGVLLVLHTLPYYVLAHFYQITAFDKLFLQSNTPQSADGGF